MRDSAGYVYDKFYVIDGDVLGIKTAKTCKYSTSLNSSRKLSSVTISLTLRLAVRPWLLKWFGRPHLRRDFPQAGHSFRK